MTAGQPLLEAFIARWQGREGGQERANYSMFLGKMCDAIGVTRPDPASADTETNDYVFERAVRDTDLDGEVSNRRIDRYKHGCFVLEARQSRQSGGAKEVVGHAELFARRARSRRATIQRDVRQNGRDRARRLSPVGQNRRRCW